MKLGELVRCTKISAEFEFGGHSLLRGGVRSHQKCRVRLRRWENQHALSRFPFYALWHAEKLLIYRWMRFGQIWLLLYYHKI